MLKQALNFMDQLPIPIYRLALVITSISVCYLAFTGGAIQVPLHGHDKLAHISAFFVLAWLVNHALKIRYWQQLLLLMSFGLFIELVQSTLPGRYASGLDLLADLIGVLAYWGFDKVYHLWIKPRFRGDK